MDSNFAFALAHVLVHEGGYVDHPKDPGGATNKGITIATFRKWVKKDGTKADLRNITDDQVAKVYRKAYWNAVRGDDLPSGVDYAVFDFGVNSGPSRAARYLQSVVGVTQDGKIGPITLAAVRQADPVEVIRLLTQKRQGFVRGLSIYSTFGKGWERRIADVQRNAVVLAGRSPVQHPSHTPQPSVPLDPPSVSGGIWQAVVHILKAIASLFTKGR